MNNEATPGMNTTPKNMVSTTATAKPDGAENDQSDSQTEPPKTQPTAKPTTIPTANTEVNDPTKEKENAN